ncbi:MAG: phosphate ABC transporter substrate-binding protein PstS [bacterium]
MLIGLLAASLQAEPDILINGAGATFPYPIYSQWAYKYNQLTGVRINYQSIGSGGGIQQIKAGTVHFGASDAPLTAKELSEHGLFQFPLIIGGVAPIVNVKGIQADQLKLTGELLADIYLGKITRWNDPAIQRINPDLKLPADNITPVRRADGSGTTWIFTHYLAEISLEWAEKVGAEKAVSWPTGVGGKGNEGVSAYVQRISGSIGYVEFAYALQNKLITTLLRNKEGSFVTPTLESFQAAAASADWVKAPGFHLVLVNQPGESSWPITGASFIIIQAHQNNRTLARAMLQFFDWCYHHGSDSALKLRYVPMPDHVVNLVQEAWSKQILCEGKTVWE